MTTPTPPGAGTFPSFEPTPPEMGTPAEENEKELQKTIDTSNAKQIFCENLPAEDALEAACSCYIASLAIIKDELTKWATYNVKNEAYDKYIDDKDDWDQRKRTQREEYTKVRKSANCGSLAVYQDCSKKPSVGQWANDHKTTSTCTLGRRWICKYSTKGLDDLMVTWTVANPPPKEPQKPDIPADISAVNFQCCSNLIKNVTIDKSAEILQSCSQTINNELNDDEKKDSDDFERDLGDLAKQTQDQVSNREKTRNKTNITLIIVISVAIVIILIIVMAILLLLQSKKPPSLEID